ncbi:MAG: 30S ribosomal protein S6 [Acidobacteriota bacterium]|nr:30S ribosomal protein S6 [Blastocatellia bacterium]MDW8413684.1 30S ribosomal protein S6 [Acidobacteriota bacterium]
MRTYEVPFIVIPTADDETIDKLIAQYEQAVADKGGKVVKVERMGLRRLAYPIRKFREGKFVLLVVEGSGQEIAELERRLRVNSDLVLRYISIRIDKDLKRAEKIKARRQARLLRRPSGEIQQEQKEEQFEEE